MSKKKTWREKLSDSKNLPKVVVLKENAQKHWRGSSMAIPSPMEVNEIMAKVPFGTLITTEEIRRIIARKHGADIGCPLTCGLFAWIAAHAAEEELVDGVTGTTPYWRTLKTGGKLNPKYPGGTEEQRARLEAEGHAIVQKGKAFMVEKYESSLWTGETPQTAENCEG